MEPDDGKVDTKVNDTLPNNIEYNETVDHDLKELFDSVNAIPMTLKEPKKSGVRLPGFLFHDGHDKIVKDNSCIQDVKEDHPNDSKHSSETVTSYLTGDEECDRLTKTTLNNSYQVLRLPANADEESIKQAFRKLSLLIHPDKCHHPDAQQAFLVVNKAYEDLQRPERREKFKLVYAEAEKRVMKAISKENKQKLKQNEPIQHIDSSVLQMRVTEMCEILLKEYTEAQEYAEKCRKANESLEKQAELDMLNEEREKEEEKKKWQATMETRVEGWRDFKEGVRSKRLKVEAFVPVAHQREQRKPGDKSVPSRPKGIDDTYKQNWR